MLFLHRPTFLWSSALFILFLCLTVCSADVEGPTQSRSPREKFRQEEVTTPSKKDVAPETPAPVLYGTGEKRQAVKHKSSAAEVAEGTQSLAKKPLDEPIEFEVLEQGRLYGNKSPPKEVQKDTFDRKTSNSNLGAETVTIPDRVTNPLPSVTSEVNESQLREAQASATVVETQKETKTLPATVNEVRADGVREKPLHRMNEQQPMEGVEKTKGSDLESEEKSSDKNERAMNHQQTEDVVSITSSQPETEPNITPRESSAKAKTKEEQESSEANSTPIPESKYVPGVASSRTNPLTEKDKVMEPKTISDPSTQSKFKGQEVKFTEAKTRASFISLLESEGQPSGAESGSTQNNKEDLYSSLVHTTAGKNFFPTFAQEVLFPSLVTPPPSRVELSRMYYRVVREIYEAGNLTAAIEAMQEGALHGHGRLHWLLGVLYANGIGVPQSDDKAILHHTFAALESIPEAHMALGYRYAEGIGVEKSCQTAIAHYREAADAVALTYDGFPNTVEAAKDGADLRASPSRSKTTLHLLMFRADAGATEAIIALGYIYFKGQLGIARDWYRAEKLFISALERGDAAAFGALGQLYASGDVTAQPPVVRDIARAAKFFTQGAVRKDAISLNGMGYLHALGYYENDKPLAESVEPHSPDYPSAVRYFVESANRGSKEGMYNLGVLHLHGRGVVENVPLAMKLFENAAARGSILSYWQLARNEQSKGNCQRALQLYTHVASLSSFFDRTPGELYTLRENASKSDTTESSAAGHFPPIVENSLGYFIGTLALAETGHGPSRWAAAQLLEESVAIVEETPEEVNGVFAASGRPPTRAVRGHDVIWLHWLHADKSRKGELALLAQKEAMQMLRVRLYELCALTGNAEANLRLGDFYYYGVSRLIGVNMRRALLYYEAAARKQNAKALFSMGFMYQMGFGMADSRRDVGLATALYHILTNTPFSNGDGAEEKEESDEAAEMRLYMAKRYYDRALEANPDSAIYAVNMALISLNFQWWWRHYSGLPYGLSNWLRLPMPYPRAASQSQFVDTANETGENELQHEEESEVDAPDGVGWDDVLLLSSGVTLFVLLLIRHHGA